MRSAFARAGRVAGALLLAAGLSASAAAGRGGDLDRTFDQDGVARVDFGASDAVNEVAVQPDGRIVVAGTTQNPGSHTGIAVTRLLPNGGVDASFGGGRVVTVHGSWSAAFALALQGDGKMVVAGNTQATPLSWGDLLLARYDADGRLDPSFGAGGLATVDFDGNDDVAFDLVVLGDGRIVAAGSTGPPGPPYDFVVGRFHPDGSLDATFGQRGRTVIDFGGHDYLERVVAQPDGKVVAVGRTDAAGGQVLVVRLDANGSLDATFDADGLLRTDVPDVGESATAVALQPDGKIVVAGGTDRGNLLVLRYSATGALDPTFDGDGIAVVGSRAGASDVAVQPNGKIVVFGQAPQDFMVARLLPNGALDPAFGEAGFVRTDTGAIEVAETMALQRDGRIVGAGSIMTDRLGGDADFLVARYTAGSCSVPNVRGLSLRAARRRLSAANCRLGAVRGARSRRVRRGRVVSQTQAAGRTLGDWARVSVVVSRGRQ